MGQSTDGGTGGSALDEHGLVEPATTGSMTNGLELPQVASTGSGDKAISHPEILAKANTMGVKARQELAARLQDLPLRFVDISSAHSLKVKDLDDLLNEYKDLVKLLRGVDRGSFET